MNKVCVVGGAGYIGKHLVSELVKTGREVVVIDVALPWKFNEEVNYIQSDIKDFSNNELLKNTLSSVDEVIYLVHKGVPASSFISYDDEIQANLLPAVNFLNSLLKFNLKKIIFISSGGTVYGNVKSLPINETSENNPVSLYGITKLIIEKYALYFKNAYKIPVLIARPSNVYGPGQFPFKGQGFIATALKSIQLKRPVTIYGDGNTKRDYLYISDLVHGLISLLNNGIAGEVYNLGGGHGYTNLEIIEKAKTFMTISETTYEPPVLKYELKRETDVLDNVLDIAKIRSTTAWTPEVNINEGLKRTWDWLTQIKNNE